MDIYVSNPIIDSPWLEENTSQCKNNTYDNDDVVSCLAAVCSISSACFNHFDVFEWCRLVKVFVSLLNCFGTPLTTACSPLLNLS